MAVLEEEIISRIKTQLRLNPRGMMISDLSSILKINRNLMAKYLEILLVSGDVGLEMHGNAKIYTLSRRVPLTKMLDSSSDMITLLDRKGNILWLNAAILSILGEKAHEFKGKSLIETGDPFLLHIPFVENQETGDIISEIQIPVQGELNYYRVTQTPAVLTDGKTGVILRCNNITSEKAFEQMAELSDARFQAILEDQTEFIIRFIPDDTLSFVNGAYASLMGKEARELIGSPFVLDMPEEDIRLFKTHIQSLNRDRQVASLQCRVFLEDGDIRHHQWTLRSLFDQTGDITEYQCVGRDITEQVLTEERLRLHASEMEFISRKAQEFLEISSESVLYDSIAEGLCEILPHAAIVVSSFDESTSSLTIRQVSGLNGRELFRDIAGIDLIGYGILFRDQSIIEVMKQKGIRRRTGGIYQGLCGQVPYQVCRKIEEACNVGDEVIFCGMTSEGHLLGTVILYLENGYTLPNPGLIETYVHLASVVLSRKKTETALRESEERFRTLLQCIPAVAVQGYYPDFKVVYWNEANTRIYGYTAEDAIGGDIRELLVPPEARVLVSREIEKMADTGIPLPPSEMLLTHKDGHLVPVFSSHAVVKIAGKTPMLFCIDVDLSERKRAEEALLDANRKLNVLATITRQTVSDLIGSSLGILQLFDQSTDDPDVRNYLLQLRTNIENIDQQVEFTRLYQDMGIHPPEWQNIEDILTEFTSLIRIFRTDTEGIEVLSDPLLPRVFSGLLDNSRRFGGRAEEVHVSVFESKDGLYIYWSDNGTGIPHSDKEMIFERGYLHQFGIGLHVSREILGVTGFTIKETGDPRMGARFEIHVPNGYHRRVQIVKRVGVNPRIS